MFGYVRKAEIKNLGIENAYVKGTGGVGILAGYGQGVVVDHCYSSGEVYGTGSMVGGLTGEFYAVDGVVSEIRNSRSSAKVTGTGSQFYGGLAGNLQGENLSNPSLMINCYATGNVTGNDVTAGLLSVAPNTVIKNSYATGTVVGTQRVGGLIGRFDGPAIENCYATGAVTGTASSGSNFTGGLIGVINPASLTVKKCYATGAINGVGPTGGLIGQGSANNVITNCAALNLSVTGAGDNKNRIIGNLNGVTLNNNVAFSGIVNNVGTTNWGTGLANNENGESKTAAEIRAENFFQNVFTDDKTAWTFDTGKLPGFGATVDLPNHLTEGSFELSESGEYIFASVTPLTVTVTNLRIGAIGPLTVELRGASAESFVLSDENIENIAGSSVATFTIVPKEELGNGSHTASVTVTEVSSGYWQNFEVKFIITDGQNSGVPNTDWYNAVGDIFHISYPDELAGLAALVNSGTTFAGKTVILDNDIDLSKYGEGELWNSGNGWVRIGYDVSHAFQGVFDGNNKIISGLFINSTSGNQGLFGYVHKGEIKDLGIEGASIAGAAQTGILAGYARGCVIENCYTTGEINSNGGSVGGLIGVLFWVDDVSSAISFCRSTAKVTSTGNQFFGGLIGIFEGVSNENPSVMTNCYATGNITGTDATAGLVAVGPKVIIRNSYATGTVIGTTRAGGLVGRIDGSRIENCYATGAVTGTNQVGGLVGVFAGTASITVANCYATGEVNGNNQVSGLVAVCSSNGNVTNCAALNPRVTGTGTNINRVIGELNSTILSGNVAFSEMTNNDGNTNWGECLANNVNGASRTGNELHIATGFPAGFDTSPWTYQPGKLPGLNDEPVDMPSHITLGAEAPNIISIDPPTTQVTVGDTRTLSVTAESPDGGELSYQWYSNSSASNQDGEAISGATESTYVTLNTLTEGTYYFYVVVTNTIINGVEKTATATSNVATLEVTSLPTYAVTVLSAGTGATGTSNYAEGATVSISAGTPPTGQVFMNWTVTSGNATLDDATSATTSFTMPANAVTVTANFGYIVKYGVIDAGTAIGSTISATYDGSPIANETVVPGGKTLVVTVTGVGPGQNTFTYEWSGTASGTGATYTTTVNAAVDAICTVTGAGLPAWKNCRQTR